MEKAVRHVDGKLYVRSWKPGRIALSPEFKSKHKTISLSPLYHDKACHWRQITGTDFSSWIEQKMHEEMNKIRIESA